jgi:excinuclease UvrABC nuclease subunit
MKTWRKMHAAPRQGVASVTHAGISPRPGVYALYRDGSAVYVGKAKSLGSRLWTNHFRRGMSMTNSALRRNVAEFVGIAAAADIKKRRYRPTADDARRVSDWIRECEVAWIECDSEEEALALEKALKAEWKPPLTKR